jgi:hypothetical protein
VQIFDVEMLSFMLNDSLFVKSKNSGEVSKVYDITYTNTTIPTPFFLVYLDNKFIMYPAEIFEPYVDDLRKGSKRPLNENINKDDAE